MLASEYGAAEEKKRKEEEAEVFSAKMNSRYNNQEQQRLEERAQDQYNHQYNKHPERTQHPDFKKHLQSPKERFEGAVRKASGKMLSSAHTAVKKSAEYIRRKSAERKAYISSPAYQKIKEEKRRARLQRKAEFARKSQSKNNTSSQPRPQFRGGFSLFNEQPKKKKSVPFQLGGIGGSMPSLFAPAPQKKSKRSKKPKNPGGIIDSVPIIGGGFGGI